MIEKRFDSLMVHLVCMNMVYYSDVERVETRIHLFLTHEFMRTATTMMRLDKVHSQF